MHWYTYFIDTPAISRALQTSFENFLKTTSLQQHFEFVGYSKANRAQSMRSIILHKASRIECVLQFDTKSAFLQLEQTTKIIRDYMSLHPMCKFISFFYHIAKNFYVIIFFYKQANG